MGKKNDALHPILRYCRRRNLSLAAFAREIGFTHQWVSQITRDSAARPSPEMAGVILQKTGGEVSYADLYSWEPPKRKGAG